MRVLLVYDMPLSIKMRERIRDEFKRDPIILEGNPIVYFLDEFDEIQLEEQEFISSLEKRVYKSTLT